MKYKIPFIKPSFPTEKEITEDYSKIVKSNWFTNFGPYDKDFSLNTARYLGDGIYTINVSNATLGILAAIKILFDNNKKYVLVTSFTFAAGPEMLILAGYTPVFIDIKENSWQPDYKEAIDYIEKNNNSVAGILLSNTFGVGNKDIDKWEHLSEKYNIPIVIDSAAGFGSYYKDGSRVGSKGNCEVFSLHATKPFAVGEGGIVSSKDEEFIKLMKNFINFGFNSNKDIEVIGINAKMQELDAAIGIRQLASLDDKLESRRYNLEIFKKELSQIGVSFQNNDQISTIPFVSILMESPEITKKTINSLIDQGVEARKYYEPLFYKDLIIKNVIINKPNNITKDIYSRIISIPMHDYMPQEEIFYIINIIKGVYEKYKS